MSFVPDNHRVRSSKIDEIMKGFSRIWSIGSICWRVFALTVLIRIRGNLFIAELVWNRERTLESVDNMSTWSLS